MKSRCFKFFVSIIILSAFKTPLLMAEIQPNEKLTYKTIGEVKLQLHIFYPKDHKATDQNSCIVFFHGGSWNKGTPNQLYHQCQYLASRGMVAISAEYRVHDLHGTTPFECVKDGKSAIRWVRQNAKKLGVDPERIAAGGASAGGQVAAATGTVKSFEEPNENLKISSRPNALVLFFPVFDNGPTGFGYERVKERWREFSPMHNIDTNTPPTIVFFGTKDQGVPVATAEQYKKLMDEEKVRCDLHLYENQGHSFTNYSSNEAKNEYYYITLIEADKFLASLGYLKGKPTLENHAPIKK